jgi:magnesium chelatase family protein
MEAPPVTVEVHLANGLPNFTIVGLPEAEVKESKDRSVKEIESYCVAELQGQQLARQAITRLGLSARAYYRILKVARTIADLAGAATVSAAHVAEAVQSRRFERI